VDQRAEGGHRYDTVIHEEIRLKKVDTRRSAPDQVPVRGWGDEIELEFRWFNPADLSGLPLVPPFLADRLGRLDPGIERGVDRRSLV